MPIKIFLKTSGSRWGAVIRHDEREDETSGRYEGTQLATALYGATEVLNRLEESADVTVFSDIDYLIQGASYWLPNWIQNEWYKSCGEPVANRDEWESLAHAMDRHNVTWQYERRNNRYLRRALALARGHYSGDDVANDGD